jgi:hypothetical protein
MVRAMTFFGTGLVSAATAATPRESASRRAFDVVAASSKRPSTAERVWGAPFIVR